MRFLFTVLIITCFAGCDQKSFIQRSQSMSPSIQQNESVTADFSAYKKASPKRWDIVLFKPSDYASNFSGDHQLWMFRIIGIPGDIISTADSSILVNGQPAKYTSKSGDILYKRSNRVQARTPQFPLQVPDGSFFVCGDNPEANDSRVWGLLTAGQILGKVTEQN